MAGLPRKQSKFTAVRKCNPPGFVGANHQPDDKLNGEEDDHKVVNHLDDEDNPGEVRVSGGILLQLVGSGDDEGDGGDEHLEVEGLLLLTMDKEKRARNWARLLVQGYSIVFQSQDRHLGNTGLGMFDLKKR